MNRGLIEGRGVSLVALSIRRLPRFMNRGLIEGRSGRVPVDATWTLPRFMNRGLIEGRLRLRDNDRARVDFPDS